MFKKKPYIILFIGILGISSCEKDDFCINPITPKLILRFYDASTPSQVKSVQNLSVWAEGLDTIPEYKSVNTDSIAIPLNPTSNQIVYRFKMNAVDGNINNNQVNQLTIRYTPEKVYVSRSCGFKAIYNETTLENDQVWMQSLIPITSFSVTEENKAHVQIFH